MYNVAISTPGRFLTLFSFLAWLLLHATLMIWLLFAITKSQIRVS
jgi:hypothetical protein